MVGLNVGQAKVKFSQVWSQVFPVYLEIGEALNSLAGQMASFNQ